MGYKVSFGLLFCTMLLGSCGILNVKPEKDTSIEELRALARGRLSTHLAYEALEDTDTAITIPTAYRERAVIRKREVIRSRGSGVACLGGICVTPQNTVITPVVETVIEEKPAEEVKEEVEVAPSSVVYGCVGKAAVTYYGVNNYGCYGSSHATTYGVNSYGCHGKSYSSGGQYGVSNQRFLGRFRSRLRARYGCYGR